MNMLEWLGKKVFVTKKYHNSILKGQVRGIRNTITDFVDAETEYETHLYIQTEFKSSENTGWYNLKDVFLTSKSALKSLGI
jgi:hypothetical protein